MPATCVRSSRGCWGPAKRRATRSAIGIRSRTIRSRASLSPASARLRSGAEGSCGMAAMVLTTHHLSDVGAGAFSQPGRHTVSRSDRLVSLVPVTSYYRLHPEDEDPQELLEPDNQVSKPWDGGDPGPCDKCHRSGRTKFLDGGERECPACKGTGEITDLERRGVSVFREADELYRYMLNRDSDMQGSILVCLDGRESDDRDFDADEAALLVFPTRIVAAMDVDRDRVHALRSRAA